MDGAPSVANGHAVDWNDALYQDALAGLAQKQKSLSPKWLYDCRGSALFERIMVQPEYYLARTEVAILTENASRLAAYVPDGGALVELGAGASVKTRLLLDQGAHFGAYAPMDISAEFLDKAAVDLRGRYPAMPIVPVPADFVQPFDLPEALTGLPKVGMFLGSTLGNLDHAVAVQVLRRLRGLPGVRHFMLGIDLVKDPATLIAAYDDAQGASAAFILNGLARLNRELDATFDLDGFAHRVTWDAGAAQINIDLVATRPQVVDLGGTPIRLAHGEPIRVAASRKFTQERLADLASVAGWSVDRIFTDADKTYAVAVFTT